MSVGDIVLHKPKIDIYEDIIGKVFDIIEDEILVEFKHDNEIIIKAFDIEELVLVKEKCYGIK